MFWNCLRSFATLFKKCGGNIVKEICMKEEITVDELKTFMLKFKVKHSKKIKTTTNGQRQQFT